MLGSKLLYRLGIDTRFKWGVVDKETGSIHDCYMHREYSDHHANSIWDNLYVKRLNILEIIYCQLKGI